VCGIFCATANPVQVIVAESSQGGRDGSDRRSAPKGVETAEDAERARVSAQDRIQAVKITSVEQLEEMLSRPAPADIKARRHGGRPDHPGRRRQDGAEPGAARAACGRRGGSREAHHRVSRFSSEALRHNWKPTGSRPFRRICRSRRNSRACPMRRTWSSWPRGSSAPPARSISRGP